MDELIKILEKSGISFTIDNNPTPERIEEIRKKIKASENHNKKMILRAENLKK